MNAAPLIIDDGRWWLVELHPNQRPLGQIDFTVKDRDDGSYAKGLTSLDVQERFILSLITRTAEQAIELLYQPTSVEWLSKTDQNGRCTMRLVPVYETVRSHLLDHSEIAQAIKEKMAIVRSGHA